MDFTLSCKETGVVDDNNTYILVVSNRFSFGGLLVKKQLVLGAGIFCFAFFALASESPPGIPSEYWGSLDVADGLGVTLLVNGVQYGQGFTSGNFYSVIVTSDNPLTFLSDPSCQTHDPCITCSNSSGDANYCVEGPSDGQNADLLVDGDATNVSVTFDGSTGGGEVAGSLNFDATIDLASGFTLISLPLEMDTLDFVANGSIFETSVAGCFTKLFRYDAKAGQYQSATFVDGFGWFSGQGFTALEGGRGYWAKATEDCTLTVHGHQAEALAISLEPGFNLVGWYNHRSETLSLDSFPANETDCVTKLFRFNTGTSSYEQATLAPGFGWFSTQGLTAMDPTRGYWLKAGVSCTWSHNPLLT